MKTEEIYRALKKICREYHAHSDQLLAIAHWINDEFEPKIRGLKIGPETYIDLFNKIGPHSDYTAHCHNCKREITTKRPPSPERIAFCDDCEENSRLPEDEY